MFCPHKNSYLQSVHAQINPRLLNRCVTKARKQKLEDPFDLSPGLNRLSSHQPPIPTETEFDPARRNLPYGKIAIPVLKRDLQHHDDQIVLKTLSTINDLLKNPEKAYIGIKSKLQDRVITVISRNEKFVTERCCMIYQLISKYAEGKSAIVDKPEILNLFFDLIKDERPEVRFKAARCLQQISSFWITADNLVEAGFIQSLMERIAVEQPEITSVLLEALANLMYGDGKYISMEFGAFDLMIKLLDAPDLTVRTGALRCLGLMTSTDLGKRKAAQCNLLVILTRILHGVEELYVAAAFVLMFCTLQVQEKDAFSKIKILPARLVKLSRNHLNPSLQLFCFKALTNMSQHPDVRVLMKRKYLDNVKKISVTTDLLREHKDLLIRVITWDPSDLVCTLRTATS